ncbi:hypothetical protein BDN72DRAFT_837288 [Pluteus cervinus]|uniref:Uncharacterized protein n=1 Tax=Pluteus cervinus TaxID=181527 RepID=A0ACD3B1R1_9AGAR|nr:hypothetical protein BDN72DRAFT_837288 [Pluteus cervinus]
MTRTCICCCTLLEEVEPWRTVSNLSQVSPPRAYVPHTAEPGRSRGVMITHHPLELVALPYGSLISTRQTNNYSALTRLIAF